MKRTFCMLVLAATAVFANGEPRPRLVVTGPTQDDGAAGTAIFGIEVRGGGPESGPIEVGFRTVACTAKSDSGDDSDFVARTESLTIPAGAPYAAVEIALVTPDPEREREGFETFRVELSSVSGAEVEDGVGEALLRDPREFPGSTVGDYDRDGDADLWVDYELGGGEPSKRLVVWDLHGTSAAPLCIASELLAPQEWRAAGVEDFDGDGIADSVWWHPSGALGFMVAGEGTAFAGLPACVPGFRPVFPNIDAGWQISPERFVGVGRFSGDGVDVLRFNPETREIRLWPIDADLRIAGDQLLAMTPDPYWIPIDAADFDGDRSTDVLLQNSVSGKFVVWYFDGMTRTDGQFLSPPKPATEGWVKVGTGDYNGDGHADLLLQNTSPPRRLVIWFLRSGVRICGTLLTPNVLELVEEFPGWTWTVLR